MANENWPIEVGQWYREADGGNRLRYVDKILHFVSSGLVVIAYTWREAGGSELHPDRMSATEFRLCCSPLVIEKKAIEEVPEELSIWTA